MKESYKEIWSRNFIHPSPEEKKNQLVIKFQEILCLRKKKNYVRLILDGEVKEGEEGSFVRVGGVVNSEHGDEWTHRVGELAATPLRGLGEASNFLGTLELEIVVVRLD